MNKSFIHILITTLLDLMIVIALVVEFFNNDNRPALILAIVFAVFLVPLCFLVDLVYERKINKE